MDDKCWADRSMDVENNVDEIGIDLQEFVQTHYLVPLSSIDLSVTWDIDELVILKHVRNVKLKKKHTYVLMYLQKHEDIPRKNY